MIEKHIKFFKNKERTQRFYDLEIENFNRENILGWSAQRCLPHSDHALLKKLSG